MSSVSEIDKDELVATKAWDTSLFKRLLGYARPHAKLFLASFGVLLLIFGGEVLGTEIWRRTIDGPVTEAATATDKAPFVREMVLLVGAYLGLIAFMVVLRYFETSMLIRTGQAVVHDLRASVFRHIQGLDLGFFDSRPTGALVTRVTTDIENLSEMFTSGGVSLLCDLVKGGVVRGLLFAINAQRVSDRFDEALAKYFKANKRTIFLFALFYPSMSLAVYVIQGTALWAGVRAIVGGELTYGEFVQFWLLLAMLVRPIRELGERYNVLQSAFASAERLFQILDTAPAVAPPPAPSPLPSPAGTPPHVRFEDVRFSYVEDSEILRGVSFEIPPGKTVAVVGATGAGKSTLVNLLLRYYDVDTGRISMDGVDLRELPLEDVRGRFGLVLQEDFLFEGSVRENLVMEREGVSEPSLGEALRAAQATDLVARLDGGLEAQVAERGATFSGGERQLLAIARALAARPDLVVLDEATAAVDSATEHRIELATKELLEGRSALVIAHRLSTIRDADEILVMARGEIRERGTHDELLAKGGLYAKLHALQFEGAASAC